MTGTAVCAYRDLAPECPVGALVDGRPLVVVRTRADSLHAVDGVDPFSGATVLARGIVGDRGGVPVLVSPMYKQAFDLTTGDCLDDPAVSLLVHPVHVAEGVVVVGAPARPVRGPAA